MACESMVRLHQRRSDPSLWLSRDTMSKKGMTARLPTVGRVATLAFVLLRAPLPTAPNHGLYPTGLPLTLQARR